MKKCSLFLLCLMTALLLSACAKAPAPVATEAPAAEIVEEAPATETVEEAPAAETNG